MVQKRPEKNTRLLNDLKNYGNRIVIFFYVKTFTFDAVFRNDQVVIFGNGVFEHLKVSTTKHLTSIMMLGFVESNGEKIPPV